MNRRVIDDSDEEDEDDEDGESGEDEDDKDKIDPRNPYNIPESSDDEEEMAELRRRVLASKPFANTTRKDEDEDDKKTPQRIPIPQPDSKKANSAEEDDSEPGEDNAEDDEFDSFMAAQPTTDRTGIVSKQRTKAMDSKYKATFSSGSVKAPSGRGYQ